MKKKKKSHAWKKEKNNNLGISWEFARGSWLVWREAAVGDSEQMRQRLLHEARAAVWWAWMCARAQAHTQGGI